MSVDITKVDYATLDIEGLDIPLVSSTQIIEFISRNEIDLGQLVAEILTTQGYQARSSPFGHDGSKEILAQAAIGPLGFVLPRVAALVKPDIDLADPDLSELERFLALSGASNGLFVSSIGFSDAAKKEAGDLFHQSIFWDVEQLVEMLKANYDGLSNELKIALPIKRIWALKQ